MCHGAAINAFPAPALGEPFERSVAGFRYGDKSALVKIALLPDIYGCNPFYQGLAKRFAGKGAEAFLVNPFHGLGELAENTREAAFARREKVRDKTFLDQFEAVHFGHLQIEQYQTRTAFGNPFKCLAAVRGFHDVPVVALEHTPQQFPAGGIVLADEC